MGYTTEFSGVISLSRKLTLSEAKQLLDIADDNERTKEEFGVDDYLQWVPCESLDGIVWDGNEKFYNYTVLLQHVCQWLEIRGIIANGELSWRGEDRSDTGVITVLDNAVKAQENTSPKLPFANPLTLSKLREMALEQLTSSQQGETA